MLLPDELIEITGPEPLGQGLKKALSLVIFGFQPRV
jgi:hypothetical protein